MLRTITSCEKNIFPDGCKPIVVPAATSTQVVPDLTAAGDEIAMVNIQNTGNNLAYFAFGQDCDNVNSNHGYIDVGQQTACPSTQKVCCYSVAGTTIAVMIFRRKGL